MTLAGLFRITRPVNATVAGLAAIVAYLIATGTIIPAAFLLFCIVMLITAAGNVINDYFDAAIDAINRPDRPIPSGTVSRIAARGFAATLFLAGILLCFFTTPLCGVLSVANSLLLIAYAARLKSTPFIGNVAVSYLSASIFLFGGAFAAGTDGIIHMLPIAGMTFLAMMSRELLKDAEDIEGDASEGASTLPIIMGVPKTVWFAFAFAVVAAAASVIPYFWWGTAYLAGIAVVDIIILFAAFRALKCTTPSCVKASGASSFLKTGMFLSLLVFVLSAIFL
jgi:geranylgeranylglycerol-phosphate geranylgeranyltransferase